MNKDQDMKLRVDTLKNNVKVFGAKLAQHTVNQKVRKAVCSCLLLRGGEVMLVWSFQLPVFPADYFTPSHSLILL